jgi:DNA polymerase III subunit epsilon
MEVEKKERITSFVCFDVETTGLSPLKDKLIEIGALKVKDGKIVDKFSEFINPQMKLPGRIKELTGITDGMLKGADTEDKVVQRFLDFSEDYVVMGHNLMFDYSFIKIAASKMDRLFNKSGIDTLDISKKLLSELESRSLGNLCKYYNITNEHAHRAYDDAKATAMLYVKLCNQFYEDNPAVFIPKSLSYKVKKNQPITGKQKNYLLDLLKYHKIEYVSTIENLTQSEASRMIDRIILNHGRLN